jgi:hypothetical protein
VSFALLLAIVTDIIEFLIVALRYPVAEVHVSGVVLMARRSSSPSRCGSRA